MSDQDKTPEERLRALETMLHLDQNHPNYEYASVTAAGSHECFTDIQFTLVNGWELNQQLNDQQGLTCEEDGRVHTRRYFRRLKQKA